jgi:hypothetical protein
LDAWTSATGVSESYVFRPVSRADRVTGDSLGEKVIWQMIQPYAQVVGVPDQAT